MSIFLHSLISSYSSECIAVGYLEVSTVLLSTRCRSYLHDSYRPWTIHIT